MILQASDAETWTLVAAQRPHVDAVQRVLVLDREAAALGATVATHGGSAAHR